MTPTSEAKDYGVLAIEVIHELQRMIDKQRTEIDQGLERERQLLDQAGETKTLLEKAIAEIRSLREQVADMIPEEQA